MASFGAVGMNGWVVVRPGHASGRASPSTTPENRTVFPTPRWLAGSSMWWRPFSTPESFVSKACGAIRFRFVDRRSLMSLRPLSGINPGEGGQVAVEMCETRGSSPDRGSVGQVSKVGLGRRDRLLPPLFHRGSIFSMPCRPIYRRLSPRPFASRRPPPSCGRAARARAGLSVGRRRPHRFLFASFLQFSSLVCSSRRGLPKLCRAPRGAGATWCRGFASFQLLAAP